MYELIAVGTSCTRPIQDQWKQSQHGEGRGGCKVPPLVEELLIVAGRGKAKGLLLLSLLF